MKSELHSLDNLGLQMDLQLQQLFHQLNNQFGIIRAHAELLESKASNDISRNRASQVVLSVLDAIRTTRQLHQLHEPSKPVL